MNNSIVSELVNVSDLSESIVSDVDDAKRALAGLLTDKDRDDICYDIGVLVTALEKIANSATTIGWKSDDMQGALKKESHKTE